MGSSTKQVGSSQYAITRKEYLQLMEDRKRNFYDFPIGDKRNALGKSPSKD